MKTKRTTSLTAVLVAVSLASTGCGDLLDVSNPGLIDDFSLDDPSVYSALVVGIVGDFSEALQLARPIAEMTDELENSSFRILPWHLGTFETDAMSSWWANMHTARWVAEDGKRRMLEGGLDASSPLLARTELFAGFSNRLLGETQCYAVFDGGEAQPRVEYFKRAEKHFTDAMATADAGGAADIYTAALAGRASVKAWQGNWSGAAQDAALVPVDFVYQAPYSANTGRENNDFWQGAFGNWYLTLELTSWFDAGMNLDVLPLTGDPRVQYAAELDPSGVIITTRSGIHVAWAPYKYPDRGSNINVAAGTEMLLVRAEAALRANDIAGMTTLMNENRASYGMEPIAVPGSEDDAWDTLQYERGATLWLEGRRFYDLSRWYEEGHEFSLLFQLGEFHTMGTRDRCMPIGLNEMESNPNLAGFTGL